MCTVTASWPMPAIAAARKRAIAATWVGAQIVSRPSLNCALAFCGSSVAWLTNGTRYSARTTFAARKHQSTSEYQTPERRRRGR